MLAGALNFLRLETRCDEFLCEDEGRGEWFQTTLVKAALKLRWLGSVFAATAREKVQLVVMVNSLAYGFL
ncbi:MAG: hypothetical protein CME32_13215 [Gimesia sp.]|nr:hypothetical protein [Gimesia sp.]